MIRLLPFGLIAVLIIGGLIFFRFFYFNKLVEPELKEVPKEAPFDQTLSSDPGGVTDNLNILAQQILSLKTSYEKLDNDTGQSISNLERRIKALEASVLQLQSQSGTQTSSTTQSSSSKVPVYIPLGSDGSAPDQNWYSLPGFAVSIDPAEYSGYTSMQLEGSIRLTEKAGTAYIRLYNSTDGSAISGEASTTLDTFQIVSTSGFTLTSGKKTYQLQVKSSSGKQVQLQNIRIKVNF